MHVMYLKVSDYKHLSRPTNNHNYKASFLSLSTSNVWWYIFQIILIFIKILMIMKYVSKWEFETSQRPRGCEIRNKLFTILMKELKEVFFLLLVKRDQPVRKYFFTSKINFLLKGIYFKCVICFKRQKRSTI